MLVRVYACQNTTLFEITCCGSFVRLFFRLSSLNLKTPFEYIIVSPYIRFFVQYNPEKLVYKFAGINIQVSDLFPSHIILKLYHGHMLKSRVYFLNNNLIRECKIILISLS